MDSPTLTLFLVQIGLVLAIPLCVAKLLERFSLSPLIIELMCGVMLGPSFFGLFAPGLFAQVFPTLGRATQAREAVTELGLLLFVFMAGLEVQPDLIGKQGKAIAWTSLFGIAIPFALGMSAVLLWPALWGASHPTYSPVLLGTLIATIFSISALPVIARILIELNLLKTDLGSVIMTSATIDDLLGWGLFAVILRNFGEKGHNGRSFPASVLMVLIVLALLLNLSNKRVQRAVGRLGLDKNTFQLKLTFLVLIAAAIFSQVAGIHATLGAFVAGVALGRIPDARKLAHESFNAATSGIFVTLYFVSIGLKANFVTNFDLPLVAFVLFVACAGKIGGVYLGATIGGKKPRQASLVALAMNARGAVGVVLTTVALEYGLIDQRIFVALIVMALGTSVLSAAGLRRFGGRPASLP